MRRLNRERGLTFLIVTHDISVGRATDRIVRMVDGQIVDEELLEVRGDGRARHAAEIDAVRTSIDEPSSFRGVGGAGARELGRLRGLLRPHDPRGQGARDDVLGDAEARGGQPGQRALRRAGREVRDAVPRAARPRAYDVVVADAPALAASEEEADEQALRHPGRALAVGARRRPRVALGAVAVLALRNRVFLRLGLRNVRRRRGRSALIVAGLMLGTTIIAAALATGDTMSQTIRSSATAALGQTDEIVSAQGIEASARRGERGSTGARTSRRGTRSASPQQRAARASSTASRRRSSSRSPCRTPRAARPSRA